MKINFYKDGTLPPMDSDKTYVWVFGSNLLGIHGAGAARVAIEQFGAEWKNGIGRQGNSYALPTVREPKVPLPIHMVDAHIHTFLHYAFVHPHEQFWVTRVGCGLAGFKDEEIETLFYDSMEPMSNLYSNYDGNNLHFSDKWTGLRFDD